MDYGGGEKMAIAAEEFLNNDELAIVDEELISHFGSLPPDYWDFVAYDKKYTHNIHIYPAMMIPPMRLRDFTFTSLSDAV